MESCLTAGDISLFMTQGVGSFKDLYHVLCSEMYPAMAVHDWPMDESALMDRCLQ